MRVRAIGTIVCYECDTEYDIIVEWGMSNIAFPKSLDCWWRGHREELIALSGFTRAGKWIKANKHEHHSTR